MYASARSLSCSTPSIPLAAHAFQHRLWRACSRRGAVFLIVYLLPYDFQQLGQFRAQVAHLHVGAFVKQPAQEFLQDPGAGGVEGLDTLAVDEYPGFGGSGQRVELRPIAPIPWAGP